MIPAKLEKMLNEQMNFEIHSGYIYLAMAAYADSIDLAGFSHWLKIQAQEEFAHTEKFYNYILERGGRPIFDGIPTPQVEWKSIRDVFESGLLHENEVTARINQLMDVAIELSDHAGRSFLNWFVDEQVEEEANFDAVIKQIKMVEGSGHGLYMMDKEMATQVFTPLSE